MLLLFVYNVKIVETQRADPVFTDARAQGFCGARLRCVPPSKEFPRSDCCQWEPDHDIRSTETRVSPMLVLRVTFGLRILRFTSGVYIVFCRGCIFARLSFPRWSFTMEDAAARTDLPLALAFPAVVAAIQLQPVLAQCNHYYESVDTVRYCEQTYFTLFEGLTTNQEKRSFQPSWAQIRLAKNRHRHHRHR